MTLAGVHSRYRCLGGFDVRSWWNCWQGSCGRCRRWDRRISRRRRGQFGDAGSFQGRGVALGFLLGFGGGAGSLLRLPTVGVHHLYRDFGGFDVGGGRDRGQWGCGGVCRWVGGSGQCAQVLPHLIDGNGEADAGYGAAGFGAFHPGGNHADDVAVSVQQRAAAVARIQRCVGLQVVIPFGRDDAPADGRLQPQLFAQGVADGDNGFADANVAGIANGEGRESSVGINLHIGKVKNGMPLDNFAPIFLSRCCQDGDLPRTADYVPVGDHQPVFADDESCAGAGVRDDLYYAGQGLFGYIRNGIRRRSCRRAAGQHRQDCQYRCYRREPAAEFHFG